MNYLANRYQNNLHVSNEITCPNFSPQDKKFVIVLFKNANELGVVPSNWIKNGLCAWPPQKDKKGYARRRIPPCLNWVKYEVKQYESYGMLTLFLICFFNVNINPMFFFQILMKKQIFI